MSLFRSERRASTPLTEDGIATSCLLCTYVVKPPRGTRSVLMPAWHRKLLFCIFGIELVHRTVRMELRFLSNGRSHQYIRSHHEKKQKIR